MNKKQLQESIMAGVKKAFRENKSLNEGFSAWSEQNIPKVDYKKVNDVIDYLSAAFGKLCDLKQILAVQLVFHDEKTASWKTIDKVDIAEIISTKKNGNDNRTFAEIIKKLLNNGLVNFKNNYCKADEDIFVNEIKGLYIKIIMSKQSHLYRYIVSTVDPGSNKIKNMPYITLVKADDNNIGLRFSMQTLLDECSTILDYFS